MGVESPGHRGNANALTGKAKTAGLASTIRRCSPCATRPDASFPLVTYGLIAATSAVWFWELHSRGARSTTTLLSVRHLRAVPRRGPPAGPPALVGERGQFRCSCTRAGRTSSANMLFPLDLRQQRRGPCSAACATCSSYLAFGLSRRRPARGGDAPLRGARNGASVPNLGASRRDRGSFGAYIVPCCPGRVC